MYSLTPAHRQPKRYVISFYIGETKWTLLTLQLCNIGVEDLIFANNKQLGLITVYTIPPVLTLSVYLHILLNTPPHSANQTEYITVVEFEMVFVADSRNVDDET